MGYRKMEDIGAEERWYLFQDYLKNELSYNQMADVHKVRKGSIEKFIRTLWNKFQNVHASKCLKAGPPIKVEDLNKVLEKRYAESDAINKGFMRLLSKEEELLSDSELLFSEFLLEEGDDRRALERSGLHVGLNKAEPASYTEACKIRALYLKRKANVSAYIYEMRKRNLAVLEKDGKA